jgi:hypothetical protein
MAFDGEDFDGLIRYLDAHPDMRDQLRRRMLDEEFLRLPAEVSDLREEVRELAVGLTKLTDRVDTLTDRVDTLAERVDALTVAMNALTVQVSQLAVQIRELTGSVAEYVGPMYELLFERKAPSLFGVWLRRPRVVQIDDVPGVEEVEDADGFTRPEMTRLRALDLVVSGLDRSTSPPSQVFLAVEVSRTIELNDVERAIERAGLLARGGAATRPAVAGKLITPAARERADATGTIVRLLDEVA